MKSKKALMVLVVVFIIILTSVLSINIEKESLSNFNISLLIDNLSEGETCYIIGHKSPDTDTVCSAILLSNYLNNYGLNCEACISGKINNETKFLLESFGIPVPKVLESSKGKKLILVDHSEYSQMIDGYDETEIIGIFDHHALGNVETKTPICYEGLNVGSTATIIYNIMKKSDYIIKSEDAFLIAVSILSDTNNLTSSTTTDLDKYVYEKMAKKAKIKDRDEFYSQMVLASESYDGMTEEEIFFSDYKEYDMSGTPVGIAYVNASNQSNLEELKVKMLSTMEKIYDNRGMKHLYVIIKNSEDNQSIIMGYGDGSLDVLNKAFGSSNPIFDFHVSRKKDIAPKLEEVYSCE